MLKIIVAVIFCCSLASAKQKNIVIIQADDIGFYDYSFRGSSEIPTANIDALAYHGIIMDRFYTAPLCSPSRGSLLTGRYPHHIGLQHNVLWNDEPWGLGLQYKLFPEYFKEAGYGTHLVGKWHLGFHKEEYTPTQRGFDTHFGYYGPWTDYFDYTFVMPRRNSSRGFDLHENLEFPKEDHTGEYATDLYTRKAVEVIEKQSKDKPFFLLLNHLACHAGNDDAPLQAKPEDLARFKHITHPKRKLYAAMLYALDQSVGKVVEALAENNLLEDTIVIYYSDNGGATAVEVTHPTTANNFPLKGQKGTGWEGGIRINCIIYAPFLPHSVTRSRIFHVSDFLPTLATLAESKVRVDREIDGVDYSNMILEDKEPYRNEIVIIDDVSGVSSLIYNGYKLLNGTFVPLKEEPDDWLGTFYIPKKFTNNDYIEAVTTSLVAVNLEKFNNSIRKANINKIRDQSRVKCLGIKIPCNLLSAPCLYNINHDPCEERNVAQLMPTKFAELAARLDYNIATTVKHSNQPPDERSDPIHHGYKWTNWAQDIPEDMLKNDQPHNNHHEL